MNKVLWVKAKCSNYYKFIKKLEYININLLDVKYQNEIIYLKLFYSDYEKISKYLVSYKFKIVKYQGIYLLIAKIKNNLVFFAMGIVGLIIYFVVTNMIVKINIIHEDKNIRELLKEELTLYGIKVPSMKKSYQELNMIKDKIITKYPHEIDWLEIEKKGMIYNVRVEERIINKPVKEEKYCDIVAKKDGTINSVKLVQGELVPGINDYVRKGDILVKGNVTYNEEDKRFTCATGEVYAEVWYKIDIKIPLNSVKKNKTGRIKYNFIIENDYKKKRLLKPRLNDFVSEYKTLLKVLNYKFILEKEKEIKKNKVIYSNDEAMDLAIKKGREKIELKLNDNDRIKEEKVLKKSINNSTIEVELFITTLEEIGVRKIKEMPSNDNKDYERSIKN